MEKYIDPQSVAIFVEVCRQKSFSKAATVLGLPNSHVSRRVKLLEESLGLKLINRTTRKLDLTDVGQVYAEKCADGLNRLASANDYIESLKGTPQGRLHVVTPYELGNHLTQHLIVTFSQKYPKIDLELFFKNRAELKDYTRADIVIDVGISFAPQNFKQRKVTEMKRYLYASPDFLKAKGNLKHPKDIDSQEIIGFMSERGSISASDTVFVNQKTMEEYTFKTSHRIKANSLTAMQNIAISGFGYATVPPFTVRDAIKEKRIKKVLTDWSSATIPILAVYDSNRSLNPKTNVFIDFLVRYFETQRN